MRKDYSSLPLCAVLLQVILFWLTFYNVPNCSAFAPLSVPQRNSITRSKEQLCSVRLKVGTTLNALKVTIRIVGRKTGGEPWIDNGCEMYQKRLVSAGIEVNTEWCKSNDALIKGVESDASKQTVIVLLDPKGIKYTSEKLASHFYKWIEDGGSRLTFVIGGADGLPEQLKADVGNGKKPFLISLSDLTFTHQFARLVLIEQIYRASEIRKGSGYHK